jgi:AAA+ superfamily predicted ATPase
VKAIFSLASKLSPAVVFVDEVCVACSVGWWLMAGAGLF